MANHKMQFGLNSQNSFTPITLFLTWYPFFPIVNENMFFVISKEGYSLPSGISHMTTFENQSKQSNLAARLFDLIKSLSEDEQRRLLREPEERLNRGNREYERNPFFIVIDYSTADRVYKDYIQNISPEGAFIEPRMPFGDGQELSLGFPLPDYQKYIKISGEIVRTSSYGIRVRFKTAEQEQEEII
jgi:hypothetical protein